jgi:hypothetical protein
MNYISEESTISEIINIPNNFINKLYNEIIKRYNQFIKSIKIYINNKDIIEPIIIQNANESDYITFYKTNDYSDSPMMMFERLLEIIQLYSKRNRLINSEINLSDGGKITYNYELIENKLEKEFIYGKKIFDENQKLFIFSNEIYSGDRNSIIIELSNKYKQVQISGEYMKVIEEYLYKLQITDLTNIYHNLQYIILFLMINEKNNKYDSNMRLNDLVKIMSNTNFHTNPSFNAFIDQFYDMILLNNLLHLYQEIECRVFDNVTESIDQNMDKNEMEINEGIKNKIENDLIENNKLITKDVLINTMKKYILRYCINDHQNNNDILNKYRNIDDIINRKDIWEEKIISDSRFEEECRKLKTINTEDNYLLKYCFHILFDKVDSGTCHIDTEEENNPFQEVGIEDE